MAGAGHELQLRRLCATASPRFVRVVLIPHALTEATVLREGTAGRAWLADLPSIVDGARRRWGCVPDGPAWHGQVALVVPVEHACGPAALRVSFPHEENRGEADALRCFDGRGAVRFIEADDSGFVLLLERADPSSLAALPAETRPVLEEALEIAGDLARQLAVPASPAITTLASTVDGWEEQLGDQVAAAPGLLSSAALDRARRTMRDLAADATPTLLHGDLHYGNILQSTRQPWLTIDPKGWSGPAAWDAFTVVAGRRAELQQEPDLHRGVRARIERFCAAAGADPGLAAACCQARAVSSYLYEHIAGGSWSDLELLSALAEGS